MLIEFSHILTFSLLFIAAIFDVRSELGDVPDIFGILAVAGGIILHGAASFSTGSWNPILYCFMAGVIFSVYGWGAYWKGVWGGADALALSALGFGAPFLTLSLAGTVQHSIDMFINLVLISFVYTLAFSTARAFKKKGFFGELRKKLDEQSRKVSILWGASLAVFGIFSPFKASLLYLVVVFSTLGYFFLKVVEEYAMVEKVDAEELEGGEVIRGERIRGVTEEELEDMDGEVEVVHGLRLMPVFPLALLMTDAGFSILPYIISG
jgi:hypothetical protein